MDSISKTAPRKTSKRKVSKTLTFETDTAEFLLTNVILTKLHADRLVPLGAAAKGVYTFNPETRDMRVEADAEDGQDLKGSFVYAMSLDGFVDVEKGQVIPKDAKKSFSVTLELLVTFKVVGTYIATADTLTKLAPSIIAPAHALGASKLLEIANELGFSGVRPALSVRKAAFPIFEEE